MSAELEARRTAASAVLADFRAAEAAFERGLRDQPAYPAWAFRLAAELGSLLARLDDEAGDAGPDAAAQLAQVRRLLAGFDWEFHDRQLALEAIDGIVNGAGR